MRFAIPALLLTVTLLLGQRPYYNWDMFPYMAIALSNPSVPFDSTHRQVYRIAKAELPSQDFEAISSRQPELMKDAASFQNILKYFTIKPGYNAFVWALYHLGANLVAATYLPSLFSYLTLGLLLFWWTQRTGPPMLAGLATVVIMLAPPMVDLARYSSPDMLCALVSATGFLLIMSARTLPGLMVLLTAVLIRPDALILLLLVTLVLTLSGQIKWSIALAISLLGATVVLFLFGGIDLFKEFLIPEGSSLGVAYGTGLRSVFHSYTYLAIGLGVITLYGRLRLVHYIIRDLGSLLLLSAMSSFLIRYLLHPVVEDRFLLPGYLLILFIAWQTITEKLYPKPRAAND